MDDEPLSLSLSLSRFLSLMEPMEKREDMRLADLAGADSMVERAHVQKRGPQYTRVSDILRCGRNGSARGLQKGARRKEREEDPTGEKREQERTIKRAAQESIDRELWRDQVNCLSGGGRLKLLTGQDKMRRRLSQGDGDETRTASEKNKTTCPPPRPGRRGQALLQHGEKDVPRGTGEND